MPQNFFDAYGPIQSTGDLRRKIDARLATNTYNVHDQNILRGIKTEEELQRFTRNRFNRPGAILGRIIKAGGLEPQERMQLSAAANRQLGLEAAALQQGYQRSLAAGGGRQVGAQLLPYGNRQLMAQQLVQDNLNKIAMERKQRALEMQLQIKRERQQRRFQAKQAQQAAYAALAKQLFSLGTLGVLDLARKGGSELLEAPNMSSAVTGPGQTIGVDVDSLTFENPYFGEDIA